MEKLNPQLRNAGNLGDILKHAALLSLARLLNARNAGQSINYFETHAFQLQTSLPNPTQWEDECRDEIIQHPSYQPYHAAELSFVNNGQYRCSGGLIIDALPNRRLFLAEANPQTRSVLQGQLAAESVPCELLLSDAKGFEFLAAVNTPGPVLGLVDPFTSPHEVWKAACNAAIALRKSDADGVIEVFSYSDSGLVSWPDPPAGFIGPVATITRHPYFLAVYSTETVAAQVKRELLDLGWSDISQVIKA